MKNLRFIIFIVLVFFIINGIAQDDYSMSNSTVTTCSGNFYDSGGAGDNYGSNEDFTMTFYPANEDNVLKFTFTVFDVEDHPQCQWDYLTIYDGENTSSTLIGEYCGTNSPGEVIASNELGALTFVFISNKKDHFPGWEATIECVSSGTSSSGIWTGNVSTDWNESSNWDDGNVPGILTDVTISTNPSGGNFPETNSGNEALCNDLTIQAGAHIYIPSNNSLSAFGEIYNNSGETGLVIKSDNSGTGSLVHNSIGVEATVKRYLTSLRWHFIGMPVANELAGLFDLPTGHSNIYLRTHNEANNTWGDFIVPVETPLELGKGYITWVGNTSGINQDETVEFKGMLNAGDYTTGQSGFYNLEFTSGHGLNLICNPFPSALEADIQNWPQANNKIAQSVWVWDHEEGNYRYWNGNNGTNTGGYGTLTDGIIPAMQAFIVQATNNNAWVTIPQSSRIHSSQSFYKESEISDNIFSLKVDGNESSDQIFVSFIQDATEGFDEVYDVQKVFGSSHAPQLYTKVLDFGFSINALPELQSNKILDLGFECGNIGEFTFTSVDMGSFLDNNEVTLEDTKEGFFQNLKENPNYSFFYELGDDPYRFKLHFLNALNVNSNIAKSIHIYSSDNSVFVSFPEEQKNVEIQIFDLMGHQITSALVQNKINKIELINSRGYYFVKVITDNNITTQKIFIK